MRVSLMPIRWMLATALMLASPAGFALVTCSMSTTPSGFGVFDPDGPDLDNDTGSVTVTCRLDALPAPPGGAVSYNIRMSPGNSGSYSPRRMQNGAYTLRYNLFVSGTRSPSEVWGDGTSGTSLVSHSLTGLVTVGNQVSRDHIVYGRLQGNQSPVSIGNYNDSITLTLDF
jgi:spore coat protein U-like protein